METNHEAIVLRRRDSGESDRRLTLLTADLGKIDAIAKGARKPSSRLAGVSEPLMMAEMTLAVGKVNRFVTQAQPKRAFPGLRRDYHRLSAALCLAELYAATLPADQPAGEEFELLRDSLLHLESHAKVEVALVWGQLRLMVLAGFLPEFANCAVSGEPISEAQPWVSPHAGGYVVATEALPYTDRFRTTAEVLYGIKRMLTLGGPPEHLKFAVETLATLLPFWREIAGRALPANESHIALLLESSHRETQGVNSHVHE
jgi:DNA repair protein RecO (recombination protein O)